MVLLYVVCHGSHQHTPFTLAYIYTSTMGPGDGENLCQGNGITFSAPSHSCALLVVGPDGAGRCLQFINIVYIYIYDIT